MSFILYLMRHAKSDWSEAGISDFDRPINRRGQKNARHIGQWLLEHNNIPQQIVSSAALRAKQTTELVVEELDSKPEKIFYDDKLYLASAKTLLEYIQVYKAGLNSLMLLAHNPGIEDLVAYLLTKSEPSGASTLSITTANVAVFNYDDNDFDIYNDKAELIEFIRPNDISH